MGSPSVKTIKRLFAVSGNACAFPNCQSALIDAASGTVIGEICHITSRRVGGPRYDPSQTDQQRNAFENLIAMCLPHHKVIDDDPDSYTVERLQRIKASHEDEASQSVLSEDDQNRFLDLLDDRIQAILDRDKQSSSDEIETGPDAHTILRNLVEKQRQKIDRTEWIRSNRAVNDVVNSINEIFTQFEDYYLQHREEFQSLGIKKNRDEKGFRSIYDGKYISQIRLEGFDELERGRSFASVSLKVELYKTRPTFQPGLGPDRCFTDRMLLQRFKPDVSENLDVIWIDIENNADRLSAKQMAERVFELFVAQISKPRPLDETAPGGRYLVGGKLVDAFGAPIDSYDDDD